MLTSAVSAKFIYPLSSPASFHLPPHHPILSSVCGLPWSVKSHLGGGIQREVWPVSGVEIYDGKILSSVQLPLTVIDIAFTWDILHHSPLLPKILQGLPIHPWKTILSPKNGLKASTRPGPSTISSPISHYSPLTCFPPATLPPCGCSDSQRELDFRE